MRIILLLLGLLLGQIATAADALPENSVYQLRDGFIDQDGQEFVLASRRGTPQLVAMFYTSCRYVCPLIIDSAKAVNHELTPDERTALHMLLISMDPMRDTPAALKATADKRKLDSRRWTLAQTGKDSVRRVAALLGVRYRELNDGEFNHTSALVLLDADGRVLARTEKLGGKPDPAFMDQVHAVLAIQRTKASPDLPTKN